MADVDKIVGQLRGEVGEIIHTWVLLRHFIGVRNSKLSGDIQRDMDNPDLPFFSALIEKLENEIVARLSELSVAKRSTLNFNSANEALKRVGLNGCDHHNKAFQKYIEANRFKGKRNTEISHKSFVAEWKDERAPIHIPYPVLLKGIALALRVMKLIDSNFHRSIHAIFMWRELRKRRYKSNLLPRAGYLIADHIFIPEAIRAEIIKSEITRGVFHQELMDVEVNGIKTQIYVSKKWGAINLGGHLMILKNYPLQALEKIEGANIVVETSAESKQDSSAEEACARMDFQRYEVKQKLG